MRFGLLMRRIAVDWTSASFANCSIGNSSIFAPFPESFSSSFSTSIKGLHFNPLLLSHSICKLVMRQVLVPKIVFHYLSAFFYAFLGL